MKLKVLDRPRTGDGLEARQRRWDEAQREQRTLADQQRASRRSHRRRKGGSRRARKLFEERVIGPAVQRALNRLAVLKGIEQEVGEIIDLTITDWVEIAKYDTITIGPVEEA